MAGACGGQLGRRRLVGMREQLLDPTGASERTADTTLAPRLRSLRGLTAGLLHNGKPNAAVLLTETAIRLT